MLVARLNAVSSRCAPSFSIVQEGEQKRSQIQVASGRFLEIASVTIFFLRSKMATSRRHSVLYLDENRQKRVCLKSLVLLNCPVL